MKLLHNKNMRKIVLTLYSLLIFFLPFIYSRFTDQIFEINKFTFILIFCGVISLLFIFIKLPKYLLNKYQVISLVFFLLFCAFLVISSFYSLSPLESFWGSAIYHQGLVFYGAVFLLVLYAVLLQPNKKEFFKYFLVPLMVAGALEAMVSIVQYIKFDFLPEIESERYKKIKEYLEKTFLFSDLQLDTYNKRSIGTMGQPNYLARLLLFPFFVGLHYFFKSKNKQKIIYGLLIVLIFAGILATKSRAGLIALFFGLFLFAVLRAVNWKQVLSVFFVTALLGSGMAYFLYDSFNSRSESTETRLLIWKNLPTITQETNFLYGAGLENQELILERIDNERLFDLVDFRILDRAHNEFIDFFIQIGLIGAIAYFLFVVFALVSSSARSPLFIAILATFLARMFEFFSVTEFFLFFLFLGLTGFNNIKYGKKSLMPFGYAICVVFISVFLIYSASAMWLADKFYYQEDYLQAHQIHPSNRKFAQTLTIESIRNGDMVTAEKIINTLKEDHPYWAETYYLASRIYYIEGDKEKAMQSIDQALIYYPQSNKYQQSRKGLLER